MTGVAFSYDLDLAEAEAALANLTAFQFDKLAFNVGQLLERSTRERIATGKAAPDGTPWAPWSAKYAATRSPQHSLLVTGGFPGLLESVQNYTSGPEAVVGTNLVYGAVHQEGSAEDSGQNIPARPYLGVSAEDADNIRMLVLGELEELLQ